MWLSKISPPVVWILHSVAFHSSAAEEAQVCCAVLSRQVSLARCRCLLSPSGRLPLSLISWQAGETHVTPPSPGKPPRHMLCAKDGHHVFRKGGKGGTDSTLSAEPSAQYRNPPTSVTISPCTIPQFTVAFACTGASANTTNHRRQTCPFCKIGFDAGFIGLADSSSYTACI